MPGQIFPRRGAKGFTLLEVMITVAILGIALTVIIQLFSGGLRLARKSEEYSRAVFYGKQLLEEVCLQKTFSETAEEGKFEGEYRWAYEVEPFDLVEEEADQLPLELLKIKVSVLWSSGDKEKRLNFETLKAIEKTE